MGLWNVSGVHCLETVHGPVSPLTATNLPPAPAAHDHHADDHHADDGGADDDHSDDDNDNDKMLLKP